MKEWIIWNDSFEVINIAWLDHLNIDDNYISETKGMYSMRTKKENESVEIGWFYNVETDEFYQK
jgi:hypothetical protein